MISESPRVAGRISNVCATRGSQLSLGRVVAFAGLYLPVLIIGLDFDFAESAVLIGVGGCIADRILAAHLVLKLAECILQRQLLVDMEHVAPRLFSHAPQF